MFSTGEDEDVRATRLRLGVAVLIALGFLVLPALVSSPPRYEAELIPPALVEQPPEPEAVPGTASVLGATQQRVEATATTVAPEATAATSTTSARVSVDDLPVRGEGTFAFASADGEAYGSAPYLDFAVATEDGTNLDPEELATFVESVLSDERSWIGDGVTGLRQVDSGGVFTLVVATPETVDALCAPLQTNGYFSCARNGFVLLNLHRWETATDDWPGTLEDYRRYLVNHEVGHYLVGPAHPDCPGAGEPAPVMMQQTKGLGDCEPNGWVYPDR